MRDWTGTPMESMYRDVIINRIIGATMVVALALVVGLGLFA